MLFPCKYLKKKLMASKMTEDNNVFVDHRFEVVNSNLAGYASGSDPELNRQGRVVVAVRERDPDTPLPEDFHFFLSEKGVALDDYGFNTVALTPLNPTKPDDTKNTCGGGTGKDDGSSSSKDGSGCSDPSVSKSRKFLEFLLRMNKTFVNKNGIYLRFDFTATKVTNRGPNFKTTIYYYDHVYYNSNCVFFVGDIIFTGTIKEVKGGLSFRNTNPSVTNFLDKLSSEEVYVRRTSYNLLFLQFICSVEK